MFSLTLAALAVVVLAWCITRARDVGAPIDADPASETPIYDALMMERANPARAASGEKEES